MNEGIQQLTRVLRYCRMAGDAHFPKTFEALQGDRDGIRLASWYGAGACFCGSILATMLNERVGGVK